MAAVLASAMLKPRLSRLSQLYNRPPIYFDTLCTFDRKMILHRPAIHPIFISFCAAAAGHGVYVGRYLLMPDPSHLLVTSAWEGMDLSTWIQSLKNTLSKSWRTSAIDTPPWQKGFSDHLLRSTDSYVEKWAYVAANPVRAGLTATVEDWPHQGTSCDLPGANFRPS